MILNVTKTPGELPVFARNYTQILGLSAGTCASVNNATIFGQGAPRTSA